MDRLEALGNTLSQITMYDIKSMYNQAKNVVLNVSEIEAKVREATNEDPWGASSTLMQDIANRTFNYPDFNEIMPSIYSRFMEKEARQWRQIYKALQLLEYLIKNGSERVVDDARSHISTIKMLRSFHYIDEKGKDQGLNVRNRAKEVVELLSDVDKIRGERRKAKSNKHKYVGTGNDGMSFSGGGGRYGGFGNDSLGYSGGGNDFGSYGAGSSGYGGSSSGFRDSDNRRGFEEYDAGDDEDLSSRSTRGHSNSVSVSRAPARKASLPTPAPAPAPAPVEDLLGGFGDDDAFASSNPTTGSTAPALSTNKALPAVGQTTQQPNVSLDDDDFTDFQAAPMTGTMAPTATAPSAAAKPNLMEMLNSAPPRLAQSSAMGGPVQMQQQTGGTGGGIGMGMAAGMSGMQMGMSARQTAIGGGGMGMGMGMGMGGMHRQSSSVSSFTSPSPMGQPQQNLFGGAAPLQPTSSTSSMFSSPMRPTLMNTPSTASSHTSTSSKPASSANFDDLWSMSLGASKPAAGSPATGKSIKDLEKEKAAAGLWGSGGQQKPPVGLGTLGSFGNFGSGASSATQAGGGTDDLLF